MINLLINILAFPAACLMAAICKLQEWQNRDIS